MEHYCASDANSLVRNFHRYKPVLVSTVWSFARCVRIMSRASLLPGFSLFLSLLVLGLV